MSQQPPPPSTPVPPPPPAPNGTPSKPWWKRWWGIALILLAAPILLLFVVAFITVLFGLETTEDAAPVVVDSTEASESSSPAESVTPTLEEEPSPSSEPKSTPAPSLTPPPSTTPEPSTIPEVVSVSVSDGERSDLADLSPEVMPDLSGLSLQFAQDLLQALDVAFIIDDFDATGEGRLAIIDSAWVVVEQEPDAGTPISLGDETRLELGFVRWGELGTPNEPPFEDGLVPAVGCLDGQLAVDLLDAHGFRDVEPTDPTHPDDAFVPQRGRVAVGIDPAPGTQWPPDRSVVLLLVDPSEVTVEGCS